MKRDTVKYVIFAVCALGGIACVLLFFPQIRQFIIVLAERYMVRRELRNHALWMQFMLSLSLVGIMLSIAVVFLLFERQIYKIKSKIVQICAPVRAAIPAINYRAFVTSLLFMTGVYAAGIFSIIRANFLYIDDMGRAIDGYRGWNNFSRYASDFFAVLLHTDTRIADISPLPQLFAVVCMAASSVLLVYIVSDKKMSKFACFMSLPIGLSPYFLECFSYKFDSPYMALSVLISIVPFLFVQNYAVFSLCSAFSVLIMCMTYQASSGIYCMMVMLLCFKAWNERTKTIKEIIRFAIVSVASYSGAMIFFRLFLMKSVDSYVSTGLLPLSQFFPGMLRNFISYMRIINGDFNFIWKILLILAGIMFLVMTVAAAKRNRIASLIVSLSVLGILCALSFGVYLCLAKPLYVPRAMYGFGVSIAMLFVYICPAGCRWKIMRVPAVLLCWCFFVFSFSYGNALADQKRYNDFCTEILLHDLSVVFPNRNGNVISIKLKNWGKLAPSVQNIAVRNPVIGRLVPNYLGASWSWANFYFRRYYHFNLQQDESIEETELNVMFDSYYHTIKSNGEKVLVILK